MRRLLAGLTVAAVVLGAAAGSRAANDARRSVKDDAPRIALVIGNTNYTKLTKLKNPGNDARLMSRKLRELGFEVVESFDRDLAGLSKDVEAFAKTIKQRGRDTVSAVFYAGHGLENDSINYLVPVNAEIKRRADIRSQALSVKQVADQLSAAGGQLNILIIDACRDNPFPESAAPSVLGLVPMGAVYGVFIASSTASGKAAFDGDDDHSPYSKALAEALTAPGEKLEDVFKSVRRQVRLATEERQIPWESTSLELDFYFVPPKAPPPPAAQLLAAAKETGNLGLFDLLLDKFPDSLEAAEARTLASEVRRAQAPSPAPLQGAVTALVLERAKQARSAEAYDLVASLFPGTPEASEAQEAAAKLREIFALDSAGPSYEGRELVQQIQGQLTRLACATNLQAGAFDATTIQGLRRASLLTDDRYLWYRPTMAALRALKKIDARDGCGSLKIAAAPRCLRVNGEDFCQ
jgi:uncharacterized caspase-like protein